MSNGSTKLFPQVYARWLSARLPNTMVETLATCDSCAMKNPEGTTRDPGPFDENLKCCTYFPFIPNFSLGALLNENSAGARLRFETASAQGVLLPVGLFPAPERQELSEKLGPKAFGNNRELLCPFFDTKNSGCSIWQFRPAVCTSYFCKSNRGQEGLNIWFDVEKYLNNFEWKLANEVFFRLGLNQDDMEMCKAAMSIEEPGQERDYFTEAAWGEWNSRKHEFFNQAYVEALKISSDEVEKIIGNDFLKLESSINIRSR